MSLRLLDRIIHGFNDLEPIIVSLMAMNKSFLLIGRHGTGKTRVAKLLSQGYGKRGFVFYDATKDDLISIAGIPDPEAIKRGRLRFVPHERSIWDKSTIVVDEITRAGKESQNLWLEILEERTCFGLPLSYRTVIATANPESYAAAFQLDEALLDRFWAVIPVPELQEGVRPEDVATMVRLAGYENQTLEPEEVARVFVQIQKAHSTLLQKGAWEKIALYLSRVVPALLHILREQDGQFMSPRTYCRNLPETIMAIAAYHLVDGAAEPLKLGALEGLRYAVATKLQIKPIILQQIHRTAEGLLSSEELPEQEKLRLELAALSTFEDRLDFLRENWKSVQKTLQRDEIEKLLGELLRGASQKGEKDKLVALKGTLDTLHYSGDALRQVDGRLLITLNSALSFVMPRIARLITLEPPPKSAQKALANMRLVQEMIEKGTFFSQNSSEMIKLKSFLIEVYDGEQAVDEDNLLRFFDSLNLSSRE